MKQPFIIVHDYETGGVVARVFANSRDEIEKFLFEPTWKIYDPDDPKSPNPEYKILESDIDNREPWLEKIIYIAKREAEGKKGYSVRCTRHGETEYREIWARSREEITNRFPSLEFLFGIMTTSEERNKMGVSDIDVQDDFLARHEKDA